MMKVTNNYKKIASHEAVKGTFSKCLLLYSGGLDTSVMLKWIQDVYKVEVIALTIDLGQTADDLEKIRQKAIKLGATKAIIHDAKDTFSDELLSIAIKANADYQGGYALSTPLGRVIISELAVHYAQKEKCTVIAHGCTGKGNDQVRFETYITTLDPSIQTIAPVREWGMGRDDEISYAKKHGIEIKQTADKPYSYDENLWGNTGEGGEIECPFEVADLHSILQWCNPIDKTPYDASEITIHFKSGIPTAVNNIDMKLSECIKMLNELGSKHGVGIVQLIEDRMVGLKVRGVYENPGAKILIEAHKALEKLVSTRQENELKSFVDTKWAYLTYAAHWYDPVMSHIHAFIDDQNKKVSGWVTIRLLRGTATVVALDSPFSLFDKSLATFNKNASFNQNASAGFIEIHALAQKTAYSKQKIT
jgi:argininosuccinate synthase